MKLSYMNSNPYPPAPFPRPLRGGFVLHGERGAIQIFKSLSVYGEGFREGFNSPSLEVINEEKQS
jgi:hypothetical protein